MQWPAIPCEEAHNAIASFSEESRSFFSPVIESEPLDSLRTTCPTANTQNSLQFQPSLFVFFLFEFPFLVSYNLNGPTNELNGITSILCLCRFQTAHITINSNSNSNSIFVFGFGPICTTMILLYMLHIHSFMLLKMENGTAHVSMIYIL